MQHNPYDMSHKATGGRTREVPLKKPDAVDQLVQKVDTRACIWGLDPNKKKVPTLVMEKNTWQQPKNARFMHPNCFCAFVSRHFPSDRSFPRGTPAFPPSCCCQAMLPQSQYRPAQQQRQAPFHQEAPQRGSVAAFARCCPVPYPVSPWGATQIPGF